MTIDPSPATGAVVFTGYRLVERLHASSGRSRRC
jgi:hypothetical protein